MANNNRNNKRDSGLQLVALVAVVAIIGIVVMIGNFGSSRAGGTANNALGNAETDTESIVGAATAVACTDTDGGKNYYSYGIVTYNRVKYYDTCISSTQLNERHCSLNSKNKLVLMTTAYTCPYGCTSGACKAAPQTSCYDTDGGTMYYYQGSVFGYDGYQNYTYTDYCTNSWNVREYYCNMTAPLWADYACPAPVNCTGNCSIYCVNGACLP